MGTPPAADAVQSAYAQTLIRVKAKQLSRKPGFSSSDEPDLAQELSLHLLHQMVHYDPARASVNTFLSRVANTWAAGVLRDRRRLKRGGGRQIQALDQAFKPASEEEAPLTELLDHGALKRHVGQAGSCEQAAAELAMDIAAVIASLPPELKDLWHRLKHGTETSVARELNTSRRWVREGKERLRDAFRRAGFDGAV